MPAIELRGVAKTYGKRRVLEGLDLAIEPEVFQVVLGPPACGKSVLLRLITGLEGPTAGQILLRGEEAAARGPAERDIGYVPQSFALYPHYSVHDNIAYPLTLMGMAKGESEPKVRQIAEQLKISKLLGKRPDQLSGGEKQRVALARGLVKPTDLFVLDDPLTGLDFKLREQLFDDLKRMQQALKATFVYMTSDPLEALALGDRVAILDKGRILSSGPVEELYRRPDHLRAMELLGLPAANRLAGVVRLRDGQAWCEAPPFRFPVESGAGAALADGQAVQVGIRPQDVALEPGASPGLLTGRAEVILEEDLGAELVIFLQLEGVALVTVLTHQQRRGPLGETVAIGVAPPAAVVFAADTGARLGQGSVRHG